MRNNISGIASVSEWFPFLKKLSDPKQSLYSSFTYSAPQGLLTSTVGRGDYMGAPSAFPLRSLCRDAGTNGQRFVYQRFVYVFFFRFMYDPYLPSHL